MFTTPTVVGDVVFVGSCSGVIYGIDKGSGDVRWTYDTRSDAGPAQFHGEPAVHDELVLTGSDGADPSFFYAFHAGTGELAWKTDVDVIESNVLVADGRALGQTFFGEVVALDLDSGQERWRLTPPARRCGRRPQAPAVAGNRAYVAVPDGTVRAVRVADGTPLWSVEQGCVSTALAVWHGAVWGGSSSGEVWSLDAKSGAPAGAVSTGGTPHGEIVPVAHEALVVQTGEQEVVGIDPAGPAVRWRYHAERELSSPRPHAYGDLVVVGDDQGHVLALDPRDGTVHWTVQVEGTVRGVGSEPGALYIGTLGGTVYKVSAPATR